MSLTPNQLLAYAVFSNKKYLVRFALAIGADPNQISNGKALLLDAILRDANPQIIETLLKSQRLNLNVNDNEGVSALFYALALNIKLIPMLLDAGIDPNLPFVQADGPTAILILFNDPQHIPPLFSEIIRHTFPARDHFTQAWITKLLISAGANVNATIADSYTALHGALLERNQAAILALLEANADVYTVNRQNYTALAYALMNLRRARQTNPGSITEEIQLVNRILNNDLNQHRHYPHTVLRITMTAALASLTESTIPTEQLILAQTYRLASRLLLINRALNSELHSHYYWAQLSRFIALDLMFVCNKIFKNFKTLPPELRQMLVKTLIGDMAPRINRSSDFSILTAYRVRDDRKNLAAHVDVVSTSPQGVRRLGCTA